MNSYRHELMIKEDARETVDVNTKSFLNTTKDAVSAGNPSNVEEGGLLAATRINQRFARRLKNRLTRL